MMSDEAREGSAAGGESGRRRESVSAWMGVLAAFKEAIEETIDDLRDRGDFSSERAREAVRTTMRRAQSAVGEARERLDLVPRREFDTLRAEVEALSRRVATLEQGRGPEIPVDGE